LLGLTAGLVFNDMEKTIDPGIQNRLGALAFIAVSQLFCSATALEPFIKERTLFIHASFVSIDSIE
jgi:hypothetical protein